jgi:hypothetical protein
MPLRAPFFLGWKRSRLFPAISRMLKNATLITRPTPASEEARPTRRYIEPLSIARTLLADFFSILLGGSRGG